MPAHATITGNLGQDPDTRFTPTGKQVTTLRICATATHKNPNTNQWEDDGAPLWITADFWGDNHQHITTLRKGQRVTVEGTLTRREYQRKDGTTGETLTLRFPRFLGLIPRTQQTPPQPQGPRDWNGGGQPLTPPNTAPWTNQPTTSQTFTSEPPF